MREKEVGPKCKSTNIQLLGGVGKAVLLPGRGSPERRANTTRSAGTGGKQSNKTTRHNKTGDLYGPPDFFI